MMEPRVLIIKKGATGDVVRTTVLLHVLQGNVTWITHDYNREVLPQRHPRLRRILSLQEAETVRAEPFDLVVSLDDDVECASLASAVSASVLMGTYIQDGTVKYTDHFRKWFDMSLVSVHGRQKADALKLMNRSTFQELLLNGFDVSFSDKHTCLINEEIVHAPIPKKVGIEARAGARWPTKAWNGYRELAENLEGQGYAVSFFEQRGTLAEYMNDIASCSYVVTGDTLAMHIALALGIPSVVVFTCTSPWEIHGYSVMEKVISPRLESAFYRTDYIAEAVEAVKLQDVLDAFHKVSRSQ